MFQLYFAEVGNPKECLDPGFEWGGEDVRMGGTSFSYLFICETSYLYVSFLVRDKHADGDDIHDHKWG